MHDFVYTANSQILTAAVKTCRIAERDGLVVLGSRTVAVRDILNAFVDVHGFSDKICIVPLVDGRKEEQYDDCKC